MAARAGLPDADRRRVGGRRARGRRSRASTRSPGSRGRPSRAAAPRTWTPRCGPRGPRSRLVAQDDRRGARAAAAAAGRADRRERRAHRGGRDDRQRQADPRDGGPAARAGRLLPLLRGRGRQDRTARRSRPTATNFFIYTLREPVGVVGAITPWNSPVLLMSLEAGAGAGRRLHGRGQARRAGAGLDAGVRGAVRGGRVPARRLQRRHRLRRRGGRAAGRASRASTRWRSRAGRRRASAVMKGAADAPRAGDAGARRQVAATSCSPTPTSRRRPTASSPGSSPRRGRPAWRARGCSCRTSVHDEFCRASRRAGARDPARRSAGPGDRDGPGRVRASTCEHVTARIASAQAEGARLVTGGGRPDGSARLLRRADDLRRRRATAMDIAREEVFGPVLAALRFADEEEAIAAGQRHRRSAWPRACGRATCSARTGWRASCAPARSGSTPTAPSGRWRRSAASGPPGSGARTARRPSRVHGDQDRLGRADRRDAGSVQARLTRACTGVVPVITARPRFGVLRSVTGYTRG